MNDSRPCIIFLFYAVAAILIFIDTTLITTVLVELWT